MPASLLALVVLASAAIGQPPTEYEVKAAFLLNFARFVEWPPEKGEEPFVVAVLGEDPFGAALDRTFEGNGVAGRSSEVRRLPRLEDASRTQILASASRRSVGCASTSTPSRPRNRG